MSSGWRALGAIGLIGTFPLLAQIGTLTGNALLIAIAPLWLVTLLLAPGLLRGRAVAWLVWIGLAAATYALYRTGAQTAPLLLVPVAVDAFVAWLFGHTLAPRSEPLIARIIRIVDGSQVLDDPAVAQYARRLTWMWAGLMTALAVVAGMLALCVQPGGVLSALGMSVPVTVTRTLWSWFANIANYAIVAAAFLFEFAWRRYALPQVPRRPLHEFVQRVILAWPQLWRAGAPESGSQSPT